MTKGAGMSDIVERLRAVDVQSDHDCYMNAPLFAEAAAEIKRLRARNAEHEARYDALEAKEEYHKRDAERLRAALMNAKAWLHTMTEPDLAKMDDDDLKDIWAAIAQCNAALKGIDEQQAAREELTKQAQELDMEYGQPRVEQDAHSDTTGWFKREPK
jgi:molecular chaperone DnaK (HSP70)